MIFGSGHVFPPRKNGLRKVHYEILLNLICLFFILYCIRLLLDFFFLELEYRWSTFVLLSLVKTIQNSLEPKEFPAREKGGLATCFCMGFNSRNLSLGYDLVSASYFSYFHRHIGVKYSLIVLGGGGGAV